MIKKKKKASRYKFEKTRIVSEESAIAIVTKFCQRYDIDPEPTEGEVNANLEAILDAMTEYVSLGYLELNEDGSVVQHLQEPPADVKELKYAPITGQQKRAMDEYEAKENNARVQALMGSACGLDGDMMSHLEGVDLKVMEAVGLAFLS